MKICYVPRTFSAGSQKVIEQVNVIIAEYQRQGFVLTLRQAFYQMVSRDLLPNTVQEYKRLGSIINDARLAGLIDWEAIEDRTRNLASLSHWTGPSSIMESAAASYRRDLWATQPYRVEVWIEKEALAGVFEGVCEELHVPYLSCRGYTSQSEMWSAAMRLKKYVKNGQAVQIFHFGDHDPSGIDMTRDIQDRMEIFGTRLELERVALNMDQVIQYSPPPNPAKQTDSRFAGYIKTYGSESWELDALEPQVLADLVRDSISKVRNDAKWQEAVDEQEEERKQLTAASERWDELIDFLDVEA